MLQRCETQGIAFAPLVVESFGAWSKEAIQTIKRISTHVAAHTGVTYPVAVAISFQRLSFALQRHTAHSFIARQRDFGVLMDPAIELEPAGSGHGGSQVQIQASALNPEGPADMLTQAQARAQVQSRQYIVDA